MLNGDFLALQKVPYRTPKWAISESKMFYFELWNGVY